MMTSGLKAGEEFSISVVMQDLDLDEFYHREHSNQLSSSREPSSFCGDAKTGACNSENTENSSRWSRTLTGSYSMHTGFVQW